MSSTAKSVLVSGARIVPPRIAAMPIKRPEAAVAERQIVRLDRAQRAAHDEQRRQHAARGAGRQRDDPDDRLDDEQRQRPPVSESPSSSARILVVADAQRGRIEPAADADDEPAERRPPHPVDRQLAEEVLDAVEA